MNFILTIATINLNSSNSDLNKSLLKDFVKDHSLDVVFLQEVIFDNFQFIHTHTAIVNRNPNDLGTAMLVRKGLEVNDVLSQPNGRILSATIANINFVNVYAFSGTNKRKERDEMFKTDLAVHLNKGTNRSTVLGGDFNCILEAGDSKNSNKNYSSGLKSVIDNLKYKDILLHKKRNEYTFIRGDSASRIDRFYAPSAMVEHITQTKTITVAFSDHRSVIVQINVQKTDLAIRGRGYWKINSSIVDNDDVHIRFSSEYQNLKNRHIYSTDRNSWWNFVVKRKCRSFFKNESWNLNKKIYEEKQGLYLKMTSLTDKLLSGEDVYNDLQITKSRIMEMEVERLTYGVSRLGPQTVASHETISIFQIAAQLNRSSSFIRLKDNNVITAEPQILGGIIYTHFAKLFEEFDSNSVRNDNVLDDVNAMLDGNDHAMLMAPITIDEIHDTLKSCSSKKSPGPDGLTYEFYLKNFDVVKDDLAYIFNAYLIDGAVPPKEFTSGIITLIPKKGDHSDLNNYRPISLLNTDYKLLTKIIANRIMTILDKVVGPGQVACMKNKSCIDNLKNIRRLVTRSQENKRVKGFLVSLDLQKAFDSVNHRFLWKILLKYGFPEKLVTCLTNLYSTATSSVLYNGFLTKEFQIKSSVRQGCPLSMVLFVIYIEPLIRKLQSSISGILVYDRFLAVTAYADDLTIFVKDEEEFDLMLQIIHSYSLSSLIKLNLNKSSFVRINSCKGGPFLVKEVSQQKILGLCVTNKWTDMAKFTYDSIINNIQFHLSNNKIRNLNIHAKALYLNTFVLSKLWYIAQAIPPSNLQLGKIKAAIGRFLWGNSIFKVDRNQLYLRCEDGGIGLVDVESKCKALFMKNILYDKSGNSDADEEYLLQLNCLSKLSRNGKEWIMEARFLKQNFDLKSVKLLYWYFIDKRNTIPKVEEKFPLVQWENIWENIRSCFLSMEDKSRLYYFVNDLIPNREKLISYGIGRLQNSNCDICSLPDDNKHRIMRCKNAQQVWEWTIEVLRKHLKLNFQNAENILAWKVNPNNQRQKAALWLVCRAISFNLYREGNLFCFKKQIREMRWNDRIAFKRHFGKYCNFN